MTPRNCTSSLTFFPPFFFNALLSSQLLQISMTVKATPVKMVALALMASTPTNAFVVMDGKEHIVKRVSYPRFSTQKDLLGKHWEGMAGTVKMTVTYVNKLCFKGHRGPGPPTKSQSFEWELRPTFVAKLDWDWSLTLSLLSFLLYPLDNFQEETLCISRCHLMACLHIIVAFCQSQEQERSALLPSPD